MVHRGSDSGSGNQHGDAGRGPRHAALLLAAIAAAVPAAAQAVLVVPGDYASIDAALAAIADGATTERTIIVEPGTYNETLNVPLALPAGVELIGRETARTVLSGTLTINNIGDFRISNFSFTGAGPAVQVIGSTVTIENNVFRMNDDGVAIASSLSQPVILNNVFWRGGVAVDAGGNPLTLVNNAFAQNGATLVSEGPGSEITHNAFFGVDAFGNAAVTGDPRFVAPDPGDFHLRAGSPLIDAGFGEDTLDGTTADIGAYGGDFAEGRPFPVQGLEVVSTESDGLDHRVTLAWSANPWYRLGGYRLHYDTDGGAPYAGAGADEGDSPIDTEIGPGAETTFTINGLTAADGSGLAPPVLAPPVPGNNRLALRWSASPGATGYVIHYRVDGGNDPGEIDVGDVTAYTLTGLENGTDYRIHVTAYAQQRYAFAVTAWPTFDTLLDSAFSAQVTADVGPQADSLPSNEIVDFPEPIVVFPDLPDKGGCFIATAAFGHYGADQVRLLRRFRDEVLMTHAPGRAFVAWYYRHSPRWAATLESQPGLKPLVRAALLPMIAMAALVLHAPVAAVLMTGAAGLMLMMFMGGRRRGAQPTGGESR